MQEPRDNLYTKARKLGEEHGASSASWVEISETNAQSILDSIENCELDIPSPLSGEWADEPTPRDILTEIGLDNPEEPDYDTIEGELLDSYEQAFSEEYEAEVIRRALFHMPDPEPFTPCDQCAPMMIQGVYCHETGCPNA